MKKYLFLSILFLFFPGTVLAQTSPTITYPIEELGNCSSLVECKEYCDEPVHKDACVAYAQSKGFYNSEKLESQKENLLQKAKTELGCATKDECHTFCSLEANIEKCSSFAKKNNLPGGKNDSNSESRVLQKAKSDLGCTTKESCKEVCSLDANKSKCSEFAKTNNIGGGIKKVGPGGCSTEKECLEYCTNEAHSRECVAFGFTTKKEIKGPGGCSSAESCREYCTSYPEECREFDAKRPQETEKVEKKEEKVVEKTEQKKENVQEKKSILRIFEFIKPKREVERKEVKVETKTEIRKEPTKIPTPTVTKVPEVEHETNTTDSLYKSTLELDDRVEACIEEGCIWKQTYCNCQYRDMQYLPTKTPTPVPTKPVSGTYQYNTESLMQTTQSGYNYQYESTSSTNHETESFVPTPTTTTQLQDVQGASTERALVDFIKGIFR